MDPLLTRTGAVVAVLTFLLVLLQEIRTRLKLPDLRIRPQAPLKILDNGRLDISNAGEADAADVTVFLPPAPQTERATKPLASITRLRAGDTAEFRCMGYDDDTWFLITMRHPHRPRRLRVTWLPAVPGSALDHERFQSLARPWWSRLELRPGHRLLVGPGMRVTATWPSEPRALQRVMRRLARSATQAASRSCTRPPQRTAQEPRPTSEAP